MQLYATVGMIAGLAYVLLLFFEMCGMTEEEKDALLVRMTKWAKRGGKLRRMLAVAGIFMVLVYYHSVGKQTTVEWKVAYER